MPILLALFFLPYIFASTNYMDKDINIYSCHLLINYLTNYLHKNAKLCTIYNRIFISKNIITKVPNKMSIH